MKIKKIIPLILSTLLFIVWIFVGALIYSLYGYRKNREAEKVNE